MTVLISAPENGQSLGPGLWCKVPAEATGGAYSVLELVLPPGAGTPLHVHHREDEVLTVVEGACEIRDNNGTLPAPVGAVVRLPKDVAHAFRNAGDTPLRLMITAVPGGLERYFAEVNEAAAAGAPAARFTEIAAKYQIEFFS